MALEQELQVDGELEKREIRVDAWCERLWLGGGTGTRAGGDDSDGLGASLAPPPPLTRAFHGRWTEHPTYAGATEPSKTGSRPPFELRSATARGSAPSEMMC